MKTAAPNLSAQTTQLDGAPSVVRCYTDSGFPIRCFKCGCTEIDEKVRAIVEVVCGTGPASEIEYVCRACGQSVAYWAYGSYDPSYITHQQEDAA